MPPPVPFSAGVPGGEPAFLPGPQLTLAAATELPTRTAGDLTVYERPTVIVTDDPASHALEVMRWLTQSRARATARPESQAV